MAQIIQTFLSHSPEQTVAFGRSLAELLRPPCLVLLEGDLGSGKTTLAKGIAAGLGAATEDEVTSPTFTLVHQYQQASSLAETSGSLVFHIDLYRIETEQELNTLGLDEVLASHATVLVEWGERMRNSKSLANFRIKCDNVDEESRRITVEKISDTLMQMA